MTMASDNHTLSHLLSPGQPAVSINQLFKFIEYVTQLKDAILLAQPASYSQATHHPALPETICHFISNACSISVNLVQRFWVALAPTAWNTDIQLSPVQSTSFMSPFFTFGHDIGISLFSTISVLSNIISNFYNSFPVNLATVSPLYNPRV